MKFKNIVLAAFLVPAGWAPCAWAQNVAVVLGSGISPYQEAFRGMENSGKPFTFKSHILSAQTNHSIILKEIQGAAPALVVAVGAEACEAVKKEKWQVPIVYTMVLEPQSDFQSDQVSGLLMQTRLEDQFSKIREVLPKASKVSVIYDSRYIRSIQRINEARKEAAKLGLVLVPLSVSSPDEIKDILPKLVDNQVDVLWSIVDPIIMHPAVMTQIINFTLRNRIPFIALSEYHVRGGALGAFSVNFYDLGRQAAERVEKVLARQSLAAVEYPEKVVAYMNRKTWDQLNLGNLHQVSNIVVIE